MTVVLWRCSNKTQTSRGKIPQILVKVLVLVRLCLSSVRWLRSHNFQSRYLFQQDDWNMYWANLFCYPQLSMHIVWTRILKIWVTATSFLLGSTPFFMILICEASIRNIPLIHIGWSTLSAASGMSLASAYWWSALENSCPNFGLFMQSSALPTSEPDCTLLSQLVNQTAHCCRGISHTQDSFVCTSWAIPSFSCNPVLSQLVNQTTHCYRGIFHTQDDSFVCTSWAIPSNPSTGQ
jgi:hypothetical protein